MPLTLLHPAYALAAKLLAPRLSLPLLAAGSVVSDLDQVFAFLTGFEHRRLVLHSVFGAVIIVPLLALLLVWLAARVLPRLGVPGFDTPRLSLLAYVSAAIGGLTHVLVDGLYHAENPLLWPLVANVDSPLYPLFGRVLYPLFDVLSLVLLLTLLRHALRKQGYGLWLLAREPKKAIAVLFS
ncbi:MAG: DUF4184 family protein [Candidatus Aenigmarchaeota archaeon]|nr:DUF4184 family protein [Candidatus Aenigmarchaeota archaeon]